MSLAMGTEILLPDKLSKHDKDRFEAALATMPLTGYVSAEYFRIKALKNIGRMYQFPEGLKELLEKCEVQEGYNDFCLEEKRDDYMGTKKRTQHDSAIHTPLISIWQNCYAKQAAMNSWTRTEKRCIGTQTL